MRRKSQGWNGKTQTLHSQPISNLCAVNDQLCDLTKILDLYKSVCPAAKWQQQVFISQQVRSSDKCSSFSNHCQVLSWWVGCQQPSRTATKNTHFTTHLPFNSLSKTKPLLIWWPKNGDCFYSQIQQTFNVSSSLNFLFTLILYLFSSTEMKTWSFVPPFE